MKQERRNPTALAVGEVKVKYFHDTATALIEFSAHAVAETKEINENIYIDLDAMGNLVAITIEHADLHANLPDLFYEQIGDQSREGTVNIHDR